MPTLLLHACCAPCSSYCLEYLSRYFQITLYFYNPNISPESEYRFRAEEAKRLCASIDAVHPVRFMEGEYRPEDFFQAAKGLESEPEGGERCRKCFELRLREASRVADRMGFDYYTTTLTISPMKDAALLNAIGKEKEEGARWLFSDFKKKNGYLRSTQLSKIFDLYRQDYCGCVFSKIESQKRKSGSGN